MHNGIHLALIPVPVLCDDNLVAEHLLTIHLPSLCGERFPRIDVGELRKRSVIVHRKIDDSAFPELHRRIVPCIGIAKFEEICLID